MLEGTNFSFDGKYSVNYGLLNCKIGGGLFDEQFVANKDIKETRVRGKDKPYLQEVVRAPLEFSLTFAFEDNYDESKIREVARWLDTDYYAPFFTDSNTERVFYCMLVSDSKLLHNGLKQGYVELTFRCDGPFSYSRSFVSKTYEWHDSPLTITKQTFADGVSENLIMDSENKLIMNPVKPKWSGHSSAIKWIDV
ncbi:phage tail protein [Paenibacillus ferrarius]|uniref:Phage tail protein n=1 Tax=Paenibacillus ferrarius TaxID=1469647 RepID=A0A1V4H8N6_9BACL|nr:phage tail domain-containing protein [Paenibacillus ferrarius]OPH47570.1 phage tail protein [Paenibacillus ferrarius]